MTLLLPDAVLAITIGKENFIIKTYISNTKVAIMLSTERQEELVPVEFYSRTLGSNNN